MGNRTDLLTEYRQACADETRLWAEYGALPASAPLATRNLYANLMHAASERARVAYARLLLYRGQRHDATRTAGTRA